VAQVRSKLAYYGAALLALAAAGTLVGTRILHGSSRDRLRLIVQQQCLPDWLLHHNPAPCRTVKLMGSDRDWSPLQIAGQRYQAMRVMGTGLGAANPFALLADRLPGAADAMGDFTLLVAGMQFREGPGFALLAGRSVPGAELLLDSSCAVAR
jgi:CDP-diacylglycerol pyrophosphatase